MRSRRATLILTILLSVMILVTLIPLRTFAEGTAASDAQALTETESVILPETEDSDAPEVSEDPTEPEEPTPEPEPTETPEPADTPTPTVTPEPTETPEPTDTPTPTVTPEPTETPKPTDTPTPTVTPEPTETPEPEPVDLQTATDLKITLSTSAYTYNGEAHKPKVTVILNGVTLVKNTDYTLVYKNCTNAGTATVTVKGTGAYTGSLPVNYTIKKASQKIKLTQTSYTKKVTAAAFTVKPSMTKGNGTITFKSSNTAIATVGKTTGKITLKKTGTVKITVTAAETKNYKKATATITLKVVKDEQKIKVSSTSYTKKLNAASFTIKASLTKGNGAITFKSSDTAVATVGKTTGKITLKKPGTVKITVTAAATTKYKKATATITLKVTKPAAAKLASVTAKGLKKVVFKWNKVSGVTGYQIQYSKSSTFASGNKTVKIAGASKTTTTLTMPAGETKYYVRIRTYKTVGKVTTASEWSAKKAVTSKTVMENWVRLERIGYGEEQKIGDYWYYFDREDDVDDGNAIYAVYRRDSDWNEKKLMTLTNNYDEDAIYTNGDYIIVNEEQYYGPVIWRYNMNGTGKKAIVDLRTSEGGYGIFDLYLYGKNLYYYYTIGLTTYYNIYKADILTASQSLHKSGLVIQGSFDGRYAIVANEAGAAWVYDAKTDKYRALSSVPAKIEKVGNKWYYATFSKTSSSSGTFTIRKIALSGSGTAEEVAVFTPSFHCQEAFDIIEITKAGAYFLNDDGVYMYDFAKKKMKLTDLTVWDYVAKAMKY